MERSKTLVELCIKKIAIRPEDYDIDILPEELKELIKTQNIKMYATLHRGMFPEYIKDHDRIFGWLIR